MEILCVQLRVLARGLFTFTKRTDVSLIPMATGTALPCHPGNVNEALRELMKAVQGWRSPRPSVS